MPNVSLKSAVKKSREFVSELYEGQPLSHMLLEEVRPSDDGRFWLITIGFDLSEDVGPLGKIVGGIARRKYKVVKVNNSTGEVEQMTMRDEAERHDE